MDTTFHHSYKDWGTGSYVFILEPLGFRMGRINRGAVACGWPNNPQLPLGSTFLPSMILLVPSQNTKTKVKYQPDSKLENGMHGTKLVILISMKPSLSVFSDVQRGSKCLKVKEKSNVKSKSSVSGSRKSNGDRSFHWKRSKWNIWSNGLGLISNSSGQSSKLGKHGGHSMGKSNMQKAKILPTVEFNGRIEFNIIYNRNTKTK